MKPSMSPSNRDQAHRIISTPAKFCEVLTNIKLRPYQLEPFEAIWQSISTHAGRTFVIKFSRQSGKDELIANLLVFLMVRLQYQDASIVCAQPTFKPQTINAMSRLDARLSTPWFRKLYKRSAGYMYRFGRCHLSYFSADGSAHVVGATARTLLIINEAQDVDAAIYDKSFSPMAASGNATKLFSGTSWTSNTLLAREERASRQAQEADGFRRVFVSDGEAIGRCNAFYKQHMDAQIVKFGRNHPLIKTQYFCEEIDAEAGMFGPARLSLMVADQSNQDQPTFGRSYAFLLDIAGQDESRMHISSDAPLTNPGRDSVSLSIVELDLSNLAIAALPTYRVIRRFSWTGQPHVSIYHILRNLVQTWAPIYIVIDATGVGEGLWSLLDFAYPKKVIPVKFTQQEKSEIGWRFLSIIETGRFRDCAPDPSVDEQYRGCISEVLAGPGKLLRWGVPDGTRAADGDLLHDDALISDSLVAVLDRQEWQPFTEPEVFMFHPPDPLKG
jgi:hypothetical protein